MLNSIPHWLKNKFYTKWRQNQQYSKAVRKSQNQLEYNPFFKKTEETDVTIMVGFNIFYLKSEILSFYSPVLKKYCNDNDDEMIIRLSEECPENDPEAVKMFLMFFHPQYKHKIANGQIIISSLLTITCILQLCENYETDCFREQIDYFLTLHSYQLLFANSKAKIIEFLIIVDYYELHKTIDVLALALQSDMFHTIQNTKYFAGLTRATKVKILLARLPHFGYYVNNEEEVDVVIRIMEYITQIDGTKNAGQTTDQVDATDDISKGIAFKCSSKNTACNKNVTRKKADSAAKLHPEGNINVHPNDIEAQSSVDTNLKYRHATQEVQHKNRELTGNDQFIASDETLEKLDKKMQSSKRKDVKIIKGELCRQNQAAILQEEIKNTHKFGVSKEHDVILKVEDQTLYLHSTILGHCSPVFKAMLTGDFEEATTKEIVLKDKKAEHVITLFGFCYSYDSSSVLTEATNYESLLSLCQEYQMDWLVKIVETHLLNYFPFAELEEKIQGLLLAEQFKLSNLRKKICSSELSICELYKEERFHSLDICSLYTVVKESIKKSTNKLHYGNSQERNAILTFLDQLSNINRKGESS